MPPPRHHFSTAAKVHPSFLPRLHETSAAPPRFRRNATIGAAGAVLLYAAVSATRAVNERREEVAESQRRDMERQREQQLLMDQYGDRESLEALEKAISHYGKK